MMNPSSWVIVLAGGEGKRLAPLTRALYGTDLPKQFATIAGERTLLQETIARTTALAPPARTLVVVTAPYEPLARAQLAEWPGVRVLAQPRGRDTGVGLLFGLAHLLARDEKARVVVAPSDHHVPRPAPFLDAAARLHAGARITLLGAEADRPESEYGWILPGRRLADGASAVSGFVEKPGAALARALLFAGASWNTLVLGGAARALWELAARHLPRPAAALATYARAHARRPEPAVLDALYAALSPCNFSRAVLVPAARELAVRTAAGSGWTDWGSPERVLGSLEGQPELGALLERLRSEHV